MKRFLKSSLSIFLAITMIFSSAYVGLNEIDFAGIHFNGVNQFLKKIVPKFSFETHAANSGMLENLTWSLDDNGKLTISGIGDMDNCDIYCAPWYSLRGSIVSVYIDNGVTSIGRNAFESCKNLTFVRIPESVTNIDSSAFVNCQNLASIIIPDTVKSIGGGAFNGCSKLVSVGIPNGVTSIDNGTFYNCYRLVSVTIPDSVTYIGDGAFYGCSNLTSIIIPENVTSIGDSAFEGCYDLISVTIPKGVTSIGRSAFDNCSSLEKVYWNAENVEGFTKTTKIFRGAGTKSSGIELFFGDSVEKIPPYLSCGSSSDIISVTIGNNVVSIGDSAFESCYNLSVYITDLEAWCNIDFENYYANPINIGSNLYLNNVLLTNLVIPNTVTIIPDYAFKCCESITSITIPGTVTSIGCDSFSFCPNLSSVSILEGVIEIGTFAFIGCEKLKSVLIPNSVTGIGNYAFDNCCALESVVLGSGVTHIGYLTLSDCTSLTEICVDNANPVYSSINGVLFDKEKTVLIRYPSGKNDSDYIIPDGVKAIECDAFRFCTNITSITIPDSVTEIGEDAFSGCSELKNVFYNGAESNWKSIDVDIGNESLMEAAIHYNSIDHCYGEWIIDKAETCIENGFRHKICIYCDSTISETIYSPGHDYFAEWTVDKEATCTSDGSKSHHCTRCDGKTDVSVIEATGHHYSSWYITKNVTCTEDGERSKMCSDCSDVMKESIPATGHNYSTEWTVDVQATCRKQGSKSHHCLNCDSKTDVTIIYLDKDGHNFSDWRIEYPETCESAGERARSCSDCGETEYKTIPAIGHSYGSWKINKTATCTEDGSKYKKCSNCGGKKTAVISATGHEFSKNSCTVCGASIFTFTKDYYFDKNNVKKQCYILDSCDASASGKITIPSKYKSFPVREIGNYAFQDCEKITSVIIPEGVTQISKAAFLNCSKLKSVTIPVSVGSIGNAVFFNCDSLHEVHYKGELSQWDYIHIAEPFASNECLTNAKLYCCPSIPKIKTIANTGDGVKITWDKASSATSYRVYRKVKGGSYSKIGTTRKTYYVDKKAKSNNTYYYLVKAVNSEGISASSKSKSIKCFAMKSIQNTASGVKLTWNKISNTASYAVWRKVKGGSYSIIGVTTKTSFTDKTAKSGKKYYYYVTPVKKNDGVYDDSNVLSKLYLAEPTLKTPSSTKKGVGLRWSKVAGAEGYMVYRRTANGSYKLLTTEKGVSNVTYRDTTAKKGTKYYYKVKAYKSSTYSAYSNTKSITDKY